MGDCQVTWSGALCVMLYKGTLGIFHCWPGPVCMCVCVCVCQLCFQFKDLVCSAGRSASQPGVWEDIPLDTWELLVILYREGLPNLTSNTYLHSLGLGHYIFTYGWKKTARHENVVGIEHFQDGGIMIDIFEQFRFSPTNLNRPGLYEYKEANHYFSVLFLC